MKSVLHVGDLFGGLFEEFLSGACLLAGQVSMFVDEVQHLLSDGANAGVAITNAKQIDLHDVPLGDEKQGGIALPLVDFSSDPSFAERHLQRRWCRTRPESEAPAPRSVEPQDQYAED